MNFLIPDNIPDKKPTDSEIKNEYKIMDYNKYYILMDENIIAENMDLETALILTKALFEEYYNSSIKITIVRMIESD